MNSRAIAVLAGLVLLTGCRDAQPMHGPQPVTSAALPASSSVMPVAGGGGETPEGRAGEITATPAITVDVTVTSALQDSQPPTAQPLPPSPTTAANRPESHPVRSHGSLEAEVWAAVQRYFPASEWAAALRVARCESGGTFDPALVGAAGERGIYQIRPEFWGSVPPDIDGQTAQAASIVARHSWRYWSCT